MFRKKKKKQKKNSYDPYLMERIQPQGGVTFADSRYVLTGSGYETCIHIYEFPQKLEEFWLSKICNINNTITTVDIATDNIIEVQKNINRSMRGSRAAIWKRPIFRKNIMLSRDIRRWNDSTMKYLQWVK